MHIIDIFKKKIGRSGRDRKKSGSYQYTGQKMRRSSDQRNRKSSKGDIGSNSGIYRKLSDRRKHTVDDIVKILEHENLKEK